MSRSYRPPLTKSRSCFVYRRIILLFTRTTKDCLCNYRPMGGYRRWTLSSNNKHSRDGVDCIGLSGLPGEQKVNNHLYRFKVCLWSMSCNRHAVEGTGVSHLLRKSCGQRNRNSGPIRCNLASQGDCCSSLSSQPAMKIMVVDMDRSSWPDVNHPEKLYRSEVTSEEKEQ